MRLFLSVPLLVEWETPFQWLSICPFIAHAHKLTKLMRKLSTRREWPGMEWNGSEEPKVCPAMCFNEELHAGPWYRLFLWLWHSPNDDINGGFLLTKDLAKCPYQSDNRRNFVLPFYLSFIKPQKMGIQWVLVMNEAAILIYCIELLFLTWLLKISCRFTID